MLKRIKIKGYKSLEDVDVKLQKLNILFGANAAGKSNLLDALQLLAGIVNCHTLKDAFNPPYRGRPIESFTFSETGLEGLIQKEKASFSIEADFELSETLVEFCNKAITDIKGTIKEETEGKKYVTERNFRYKIEIEISPKTGMLRVCDEFLTALNPDGEISKKRNPFLEKKDDKLFLRMEGQAHPRYYEIGLDHSILSLPHFAPYYPHLYAVQKELASYKFFYFEPRERMRSINPVKETYNIGLMGEDLASFLNTLQATNPKQFKTIEKAIKSVIPSISGLELNINKFGEVELNIRENNKIISSRLVSEGTLRLLGLFALSGTKEKPALIGFEEPENGIHPRRIERIAEFLKNRIQSGDTQYIITTHSPILPNFIDNQYLLMVNKKDGKTQIKPFIDKGLFKENSINTNLNDEETTFSEKILRGDFDEND